VTEDRKFDGLVLGAGVDFNLALPSFERLSRGGFVSVAAELALVRDYMQRLSVRARDSRQFAGTLSGGNQQKVVMGKWLATAPRVLLLDEPTRGVDVSAKAEIHRHLRALAASGMALLVASSEIPELLALCDRIVVMRQGRVVGERPRDRATPAEILSLATGATERRAS